MTVQIVTEVSRLGKPCLDVDSQEEVGELVALLQEAGRESKWPLISLTAPEIGRAKRLCVVFGEVAVVLVNPVMVGTKGDAKRRLLEAPYAGRKKFWISMFPEVTIETGLDQRVQQTFDGNQALSVQHDLFLLQGKTLFDTGELFDASMMDSREMSQRIQRGLKLGRNDPCPCGSGAKYKKCHMGSTTGLKDRTEE